jgi:hypothetical protein
MDEQPGDYDGAQGACGDDAGGQRGAAAGPGSGGDDAGGVRIAGVGKEDHQVLLPVAGESWSHAQAWQPSSQTSPGAARPLSRMHPGATHAYPAVPDSPGRRLRANKCPVQDTRHPNSRHDRASREDLLLYLGAAPTCGGTA